MKTFLSLMAAGLMALAFITSGADAHAAVGPVLASTSLVPLALAGAGSIARIASCAFGPRIAFDKPNEGGSGGKSAAELAAEFKRDFETKHDKVKEIAEKALAEAEKGTPLAQTAKELADQAITAMTEAKARMDEIEQKMARGRGGDDSPRTAGERFVEDEGFKAFAAQTRPRGRAIVEVKDITSLTTDAAGSVGTLTRRARCRSACGASRSSRRRRSPSTRRSSAPSTSPRRSSTARTPRSRCRPRTRTTSSRTRSRSARKSGSPWRSIARPPWSTAISVASEFG